jgi:hypothetical protein
VRTFKDKNNQTITFERMDTFRLLHEILVDFLGARGNKDRDKHDGLTKEHQLLKDELSVLLSLVSKRERNINSSKELDYLTRNWIEQKEKSDVV